MPTVHIFEGPGGTLDAHTFTCETWYSLLQITSPAPGRSSGADLKHMSSAVLHGSLGRCDR